MAASGGAKLKDEKWRLHKSWGSFMAGSTAGVISTVGLQPLEVIKTNMQARDGPYGHSIRGAAKAVIEKDGIRGFWRGTGPACVRIGFGAGIYFATLGPVLSSLQNYRGQTPSHVSGDPLQEKLPAAVSASAGALTRLLASAVTCPITVVKTRMEARSMSSLEHLRFTLPWLASMTLGAGSRVQYAAASGLNYTGTASALLLITRNEGLSGLYSGLLPTLVRDAPYSGLYLLLYNRIRYFLRENFSSSGIDHLYINFVSGALAGSSATLFTHPPDVVRTRLQLEKGGKMYLLSTVRQIVQVEGMKGFFVGVVPRIGRRGLQQAFSWTIFEEVSTWVNQRSQ